MLTCDNYHSGWRSVTISTMINYDVESYPLEIKTDSVLGNKDYEQIKVWFYTAEETDVEENIGGFYVNFKSTPQYWVYRCKGYTNFPAALTIATEKIWRITVTKSSGVRLKVFCNGEEVLDLLLSESTCTYSPYSSTWNSYWTQDMAKIRFYHSDTASDFFRPTGNRNSG